MKDIIFIDSEISNSGKICDLGALKDDNSFCHTKDKNEFKRFVSNSKYIIGHNIIDFDLKYISDLRSWKTHSLFFQDEGPINGSASSITSVCHPTTKQLRFKINITGSKSIF